MELLDKALRASNPYYEAYKSITQVLKKQELKDRQFGTMWQSTISLIFKRNKNDDQRRYNIPNHSGEIAVVFSGENGEPPTERDFTFHPKDPSDGSNLNRINLLSHHRSNDVSAYSHKR